MRPKTLISAVTILFFFFLGLTAAQENSNVTIKKVKVPQTSPASGQEMYVSYCASCHGKDAKGNGPAAPALKVAPTDLTALAKNNKGAYPSDHVATVISGAAVTAHGSKDMPVWGSLFRSISAGHSAEVQQRVTNLTKYIESMQAK
jgi:mono/diheme cytochrome c family protein